MSGEFEIKKISQETLGEYLFSIREHLGFTLEEVAQKTGIFEKFIRSLEQGAYQSLPPDVYVLGFIKKLAELYKVSCEDLTNQYKKEKGIALQTDRNRISPDKTWKTYFSNLTITPKLLTVAAGAMLGVGAFFYVIFQVFSVNRTPALTIFEPQADPVLKGSSVAIRGETEPGISISVNGQNVLVSSDGTFETTLGVAPGQKDFHFQATNKFGKTKNELVSLRIDEPTVAGEVTSLPSELILELQFTKAATITVKRDGVDLPEETVPSGATKKIVADESIEVTTSDAGNTNATFNGKKLGALGKTGEHMTIPFTKEAEELVNSEN